ncbi:MAG: sulfate adenylyltransferase [Rhodospirillales bacterium]|nr:sulfate adenylyltransferase [Rhodospirillales bacterium]
MPALVRPHGGDALVPLLVSAAERELVLRRARTMVRVPMTSRETSDVIMMAMGAYTPLSGFMGKADWSAVVSSMKTSDGLFWPIPITLSVDEALAARIAVGDEVALVDDENGETMGTLGVTETYTIDKALECRNVFLTEDAKHPGVAKVIAQGPINLAGPVKAASEGGYAARYPKLFLRPAESRALFQKKGWSRVAAFQTRNPMHRSHEHLVKIAIEVTDGVFIHQVLGKLKEGDIPAEVRAEAIDALVEKYFVPGTAVQAGYPIEMRYAGPREALLHALIRQNFGCSHMIVGRDHAGVGSYYGPFDAQKIFDTLWPGALEIQAMKLDVTFFCRLCDGMATGRTCPHGPEHQISISGTRQREILSQGGEVPPEFSRPEVVAVLRAYYSRKH